LWNHCSGILLKILFKGLRLSQDPTYAFGVETNAIASPEETLDQNHPKIPSFGWNEVG